MLELLQSLIAAPFLPTFDALAVLMTHLESLRVESGYRCERASLSTWSTVPDLACGLRDAREATYNEQAEGFTIERAALYREEKNSNRNEEGEKEGSYWRWNESKV